MTLLQLEDQLQQLTLLPTQGSVVTGCSLSALISCVIELKIVNIMEVSLIYLLKSSLNDFGSDCNLSSNSYDFSCLAADWKKLVIGRGLFEERIVQALAWAVQNCRKD